MTDSSRPSTHGHLISWIVLFLYGLFTLLPNSNSLAVDYPWVLLYQSCFLGGFFWFLARLWLVGKLSSLGKGWDIWSLMILLATFISITFAQFKAQAIWNAITVICSLATVYVLSQSLTSQQSRSKLLKFQGLLSIAFILVSLFLWLKDTYFSELSRLAILNQTLGLNLYFDFSILDLRNWAPLGHPNYVGGYLVLCLPLLVALAISEKGNLRRIYTSGVVLGLIDLYTTSSKAAWLSLVLVFLLSILLLFWQNKIPRKKLSLIALSALVVLGGLIAANNRLSRILSEIFSGRGGSEELIFRTITNEIGFHMGLSHLWSGIGIGGVPLLYQKYHPVWAGFQAEWLYQLHSTPVQLWAEMGIWGILLFLLTLVLLIYQFFQINCFVHYSIYLAIIGYFLVSLADYQLDNLPIVGLLVIYLACLRSSGNHQKTIAVNSKAIFYPGLALLAAMIIWSTPVQMAWSISNRGFLALSNQNIREFSSSLVEAYNLAKWEPYYPLQLGWNLGNLALDPEVKKSLFLEGINWLEKGVEKFPDLEFVHSSLGWLYLKVDKPEKATASFIKAIELMPAKRNNGYGLALSLLVSNKKDLAIKALTLECLRRPIFITSPFWQSEQLRTIYPKVLEQLTKQYDQLLSQYPQSGALNQYLHQSRGALHWWSGDLAAATKDWQNYQLGQLLVKQAKGQSIEQDLQSLGNRQAQLLLQAWYDPKQRVSLIDKAWSAKGDPPMPEDLRQQFIDSFANASTLDQWIKQKSPILQYRNRRLNFNVNSRHLGGPLPLDFQQIQENAIMSRFLEEILPSPVYFPPLDQAIEPIRQEWLKQIKQEIRSS